MEDNSSTSSEIPNDEEINAGAQTTTGSDSASLTYSVDSSSNDINMSTMQDGYENDEEVVLDIDVNVSTIDEGRLDHVLFSILENDDKSVSFSTIGDGVTLPDTTAAGPYNNISSENNNETEYISRSTELQENRKFAAIVGLYFTMDGGDQIMACLPPSPLSSASPQRVVVGSGHHRGIQSGTKSESSTIEMDDGTFRDEYSTSHSHHTALYQNRDQDDINRLRLLAGQLNANWGGSEYMTPTMARRLRDFQFAQKKRRQKYGKRRPWGIFALYEHLASIRMDVDWAEDAAFRRHYAKPYLPWSDFEASKKTGFNRPFFTYLTLTICTSTLVASIALNGWRIEPMNINPMIGPSADTLLLLGAKETNLIVNEKEVWRLFSPMFLHAGVIHFALNMLVFWFVGSAIEMSHGFVPALLLFVIPALGGTILSAIFLPHFISVGASGGIFGLIGACLSDILMNWRLLFSDFASKDGKKVRHIVAVLFLLLDIVVDGLIGLTPFVDNFTHLGGMCCGFLCGLASMSRVSPDLFGDEQRCWSKTKHTLYQMLGFLVTLVGITVATFFLFSGDGKTTPCPACKALSCIPFPWWEPPDKQWWYCDDCSSVTALTTVDTVTGTFGNITMKCPNGDKATFSLGTEMQEDRGSLESQLPDYCRQYCL